MDYTISVSDKVEQVLAQKAATHGKDVKTIIEEIVEIQVLRPSLKELLAPVRQEFAESGMTEDDLDEFLYSVRRKAKAEKQTPTN